MASYHQAQRQYDSQHDAEGERWDRYSEAVSARVSELEKCPDAIERAINEVDCDHTDELMALRVKAFMTGRPADRHALETRENALVTAVLLRFAKRDVGDETGYRKVRTAEAIGDLFQRGRARVAL
ncbi:hypothetical protein [Lysobacter enzymogenes]|uniref:hypothetical protein n=1 Tax=Lysobacter enzymogenes TaxID=69 RepID=UPI00089C1DE7|nr:hypothetical protein [Lysobacter enzymogenes]SDX51988.1 hypothetical protein SAMN05421681_1061 [Lysobacter enzymogenes]